MHEGCALLGEVKEGLIPDDQREKIFTHRKQELLAYAAYTSTQRRLWTVLIDSDPRLASLADTLQPKRSSRERSSRDDGRRTG